MPVYVIAEVAVQDQKNYDRYKSQVASTVAQYGGRFLVRGGEVRVLEGDWDPARIVIIEFADSETAYAWWSSNEYAAPKALRQASAKTQMILVRGIQDST